MTYSNIADMADSTTLRRRLIACAADESKGQPEVWVSARIWPIVTSPGWVEAWDYAEGLGVTDPGISEEVISDEMILAVIQPME